MKSYTELFEEKLLAMTDKELIKLCDKENGQLAKTYGKSHHMSIPPQITDTDMLFAQLTKRFEKSIESDSITTHDLTDLDQARDDYYNRDKLFERKQVKDK